MKKLLVLVLLITLVIFIFNFVKTQSENINTDVLPSPKTTISKGNQSNIVLNQSGLSLSLPAGFGIGVFADDLQDPRVLTFSPDGTLLVSETSAGKVMALPDRNGDGVADERKVVISNLRRPHGLVFYQGKLFVAEETRITRYLWDEEALSASLDKVLFNLPSGGRHFTRSLVFDKNGRLFVSIGSTCDVCYEKNTWFTAVIVSDADGGDPTLFAEGLRNSVFIAVNPQTDELWGTEMGRDYLGDELPPDEINIIGDGKNYGWPICYGSKIHDTSFDKNIYKMDPCATTVAPIYEIAAHSAPLGLVFINSSQFPVDWQGDLLVAFHGSWNRSVPTGYKVVRIKLKDKKITQEDFITGFIKNSQIIGRPVDLIFDKQGSLYISDDKSNKVYKVAHQ